MTCSVLSFHHESPGAKLRPPVSVAGVFTALNNLASLTWSVLKYLKQARRRTGTFRTWLHASRFIDLLLLSTEKNDHDSHSVYYRQGHLVSACTVLLRPSAWAENRHSQSPYPALVWV